MWQVLIDHFRRYPAQERVVRLLIQNGLRIAPGDESDEGAHAGKVHAGDIEIADTALARAAGVDRRIVRSTVETILGDARLSHVFRNFAPTLQLRDVAPELGCGVIEIIPTNANQPGILAGVSQVIASQGLSIRQAIVEDPDFVEEPRLYVVTDTRVPGRLLQPLQDVAGVRGVTVF